MPSPDEPTRLVPSPHDVPTVEPGVGSHRAVAQPTFRPGQTLGEYTLIDVLGEGGFGVVYLAEQREPIRRRVALKVLKPGMDSAEVLARFEAERQALAVMDHPNIAKVYDAGLTPNGLPYFAMEYVAGVPIAQACAEAGFSTRELLRLFLDVCHAVRHAHQKGIIHRDLKPGNIIVARVDDRPLPKIIDFGIAKAVAGNLTDRTLMTGVGRMLGTPEYMSPEQAAEGSADIDTRADIYSLGVILYELLTGSLPFDAASLRRAGFDAMRRVIREVDPPKPSTKLRELLAGDTTIADTPQSARLAERRKTRSGALIREVAGELDWIVMKCLEKDRARRYDSAAELSADVERYLRDEPVLAGPPSATYRFAKLVRRHRVGASVIAGLAVLVPAALAVVSSLYVQARDARAAADAEAQKAKASLEFLAGMFSSIDPNASKGREVTVRELLDAAASRADTDFAERPREVQAAVREMLGEAYHGLGKTSEALTQLRKSVEIYETSREKGGPEALQATHNLGAAVLSAGQYAEGVKILTSAFEGRRARFGLEHADSLASLSLLAYAQQQNGDMQGAERSIRDALAGQEKLLGHGNRDTIDTRSGLADLLENTGRLAESEVVARDNVRLAKQYLGDDDTKTLEAMSIHASILHTMDRGVDAEPIIREVVSRKNRILGPDHRDALVSQNLLALVLKDQGKNDEAVAVRRAVVDAATRALGREHPTTLVFLGNLAQDLHHAGRFDEAEKLYRELLESRRKSPGPNTRDGVIAMSNLGLLLVDAKRPDEALPYLEGAADAAKVALPPEHWMVGACQAYVGECLLALGRLEQAEQRLAQGYEHLKQTLGPDHARARKAAGVLARLFEARGDAARATEWKSRAGPESAPTKK